MTEPNPDSFYSRMMNVQLHDNRDAADDLTPEEVRADCAEIAAEADQQIATLREQLAGANQRANELDGLIDKLDAEAQEINPAGNWACAWEAAFDLPRDLRKAKEQIAAAESAAARQAEAKLQVALAEVEPWIGGPLGVHDAQTVSDDGDELKPLGEMLLKIHELLKPKG